MKKRQIKKKEMFGCLESFYNSGLEEWKYGEVKKAILEDGLDVTPELAQKYYVLLFGDDKNSKEWL